MKLYIKEEDSAKVLNDKILNAELLSANCRRITVSSPPPNSAFEYLKELPFTRLLQKTVWLPYDVKCLVIIQNHTQTGVHNELCHSILQNP